MPKESYKRWQDFNSINNQQTTMMLMMTTKATNAMMRSLLLSFKNMFRNDGVSLLNFGSVVAVKTYVHTIAVHCGQSAETRARSMARVCVYVCAEKEAEGVSFGVWHLRKKKKVAIKIAYHRIK